MPDTPQNLDRTKMLIYEDGQMVSCPKSQYCLSRMHSECSCNRKTKNNGTKNPDVLACLDNRYTGNGHKWEPINSPLDNVTFYVTGDKITVDPKQGLDSLEL